MFGFMQNSEKKRERCTRYSQVFWKNRNNGLFEILKKKKTNINKSAKRWGD
jgi:hypothetical protein